MFFVGIDLASSENNPTGLASIKYEDCKGEVGSFDE